MKKLISMFKSLPPEMRMMLAMAGLGSPAGIIYILKKYLFPGWSWIKVILVVAAVIAVISLLGFIVAKLFGRGRRKRSKKMAADLASEADSDRVSMDGRAAIKANNEKFFNAIRDMRKNLGLSVYDLPWYVVIGDSGCGKTRLINEGGLTFSTGKPEGYQLGTLNYNWWFTEDAIFVDMAGRLCNPQEDADRREWQAVLGAIAKGRKGFPINGVLVCVSAEHLLQDPAEKVEQEANTALERLRDLQGKLGVTFATYLVVTKCDKILGFMQLFDRAERDITVKNQIFGWSKPGDFHELHDPESFGEDFDRVYERLNELRLRRLNDEVDEIDVGMAYSFPEEFRELRAPLQTYVRTLFPMIKNPRAIKNLIFRGIYFTSATQEGELILKHLTERLGADAAGQFPTLDLYPNKRPYFIKDLLFRKVFPEHGLVFRNEEQAVRNRKLGKMLRVGSVALAVLLFGMVGVSTWKFRQVIGKPRDDAWATKPDDAYTPRDALARAGDLGSDVTYLRSNLGWARVLSLGIGTHQPINDLNTIRAGLFEKALLREALQDIGEALRSTKLGDPRDGEEARLNAAAYLDALEQYVAWFSCADEANPADHMDFDSFKQLCAVVYDEDSPIVAQREDFFSQASAYFNVIQDKEGWRNPARFMGAGGVEPPQTIRQALQEAHRYLKGYATLDADHPDAKIREWMRIRAGCADVESSYGQILDAAREDPQTLEELQAFKKQFVDSYVTFASAVEDLRWQGEASGIRTVIPPLRTAILAQQALWVGYQEKLEQAYESCSSVPDERVSAMVASLGKGSDEWGLPGLDRELWSSLREARLTDRQYDPALFDVFEEVVREVHTEYAHVITLETGEGTESDALLKTDGVQTVGRVVTQIHDRLLAAELDPSGDAGTPGQWIEEL
ncbi:MAG: type VI secretion protein IcmF/TssM N-terminal domain-containing protein, partial [Planctomycetota bacterium]